MDLPKESKWAVVSKADLVQLDIAGAHVRRPIHQNKWESTAAAKFRRAKILDPGTGFLATGLHYIRGGDAVVPDDYHHFHNGIWAALVRMGVPADGADGNGFPETGIFN
jgi:hypothetical protein